MKNNKGFTLVELLATITILGIIMLIAVPNIMGTVERNKKTTYIEDAKKMVSLAEYKMRTSSNLKKPTTGCKIKYKLTDLDTGDLSDPPEGGEYNEEESFVIISYGTVNENGSSVNKYIYQVQIVEDVKKSQGTLKKRGIVLTDSSNLSNDKIELKNSGWQNPTISNVCGTETID